MPNPSKAHMEEILNMLVQRVRASLEVGTSDEEIIDYITPGSKELKTPQQKWEITTLFSMAVIRLAKADLARNN